MFWMVLDILDSSGRLWTVLDFVDGSGRSGGSGLFCTVLDGSDSF